MSRIWTLELTDEQAEVLGYALSTAKHYHSDKVSEYTNRIQLGAPTKVIEHLQNAKQRHRDVMRVIEQLEWSLDTAPITEE